MTTKRRRQFTANFKKRVALEALRGDRPVQAIAAKHEIHPNQVGVWKRQAVDGLEDVFAGSRASRESEHETTIRDLRWSRFFGQPAKDSDRVRRERRHSSAGANPARQLSLQPVAVGADDGGNDIG